MKRLVDILALLVATFAVANLGQHSRSDPVILASLPWSLTGLFLAGTSLGWISYRIKGMYPRLTEKLKLIDENRMDLSIDSITSKNYRIRREIGTRLFLASLVPVVPLAIIFTKAARYLHLQHLLVIF